MTRRVLMGEVSGGRVRGRPRSGWMDGAHVKVALGNRAMTVEAARQCVKDRKEWRALVHMLLNEFLAAIFAWPCVLSACPPVVWWLSSGEGWDDVTWFGWDKLWKELNYWKLRPRCQVYGLRGVWWWLCLSYLTWHVPLFGGGRKSWYIFIWVKSKVLGHKNDLNKNVPWIPLAAFDCETIK